MLPTLLWRCPLCATNDALTQSPRPFRDDLVRCRACRAEWRLRRVPGDDFYLELTHVGDDRGAAWRLPAGGGPQDTPSQVGDKPHTSNIRHRTSNIQHPVAAWYDAMKATVRLAPIHDPALALGPGETLYLASGPAILHAEEDDPRCFPAPAPNSSMRQAAPGNARSGIAAVRKPPSGSAGHSLDPKQPAEASSPENSPRRIDKRAVRGRPVGAGRLFLTDRRLAWQGEAVACDFPLARLNSAYALLADGLVLMVELRLYTVRFLRESLLKWVTYIALVAPQVEAATGHRIATSHV